MTRGMRKQEARLMTHTYAHLSVCVWFPYPANAQREANMFSFMHSSPSRTRGRCVYGI